MIKGIKVTHFSGRILVTSANSSKRVIILKSVLSTRSSLFTHPTPLRSQNPTFTPKGSLFTIDHLYPGLESAVCKLRTLSLCQSDMLILKLQRCEYNEQNF